MPSRYLLTPAPAGLTRPAVAILALCLLANACPAADFFVAPAGNDASPGTRERPFATVQRAQQAAEPGDTVFIRGGTYLLREAQVAKRERIWAYVTQLDKSGTPGKPIRYWACPNERPVFDLSQVKPAGCRVTAFRVNASWIHLKGLEVTGVQVTLTNHTQSICFENGGSHNVYEQLTLRDGMAIGIYSVRGSNNLFLNCDAYRNHDPISEGGRGGNVDGFGCHPPKGSTNNVFRGCRAWFNSDDGFDCINAHEGVTFENCWAFCNGYSPEFKSLADGNGFKAGGYGSTPAERLPATIPRHTVRDCLAARNKASGFYANHHPGGCDWFANRACRNKVNFNLLGRLADNRTDIPGRGHTLSHNVAFKGGANLSHIDTNACTLADNHFDADVLWKASDFHTTDESRLAEARTAEGELPEVNFLVLKRERSDRTD